MLSLAGMDITVTGKTVSANGGGCPDFIFTPDALFRKTLCEEVLKKLLIKK